MRASGMRTDTTGNTAVAPTFVSVRWSQFSGNPIGFSVVQPAGNSGLTAMITNSMVNHNTSFGVAASGPEPRPSAWATR